MILIGDTHGFKTEIHYLINKHSLTGENLIHVGDFGIGFHEEDESDLKRLNDFLIKTNNILYATKGNHDDPKYFNGDYIFSNLKLLPDYSIETIEGKNVLFIGGAISIDRKPRMLDEIRTGRVKYWANEGLVVDNDKLDKIKDINVVITHTSPDFAYPVGFNALVYHYAKNDYNLLNELTKERSDVTTIYNKLIENGNPIKNWFYGHFHDSKLEEINGVNFRLLDIDEIYDFR